MKALTNKQRAKIYRRAAEYIFKNMSQITFCCEAIHYCRGKQPYMSFYKIPFEYSELNLFKSIKDKYSGGWWKRYENEPRILALLFAEQIALNT